MIKDILLFLLLSAPIVVFLGLFILVLDMFTYKQITKGLVAVLWLLGLCSVYYPPKLDTLVNAPYYYGIWIGKVLNL